MASSNAIVKAWPLGFQWGTLDPFLFCVHHDDAYPAGNEQLGPAASLDGRDIGQDFEGKDGWRMYHGNVVPGFPQHPHRGFETVTLVRKGLIDHADSLGAVARFGEGDVQWLTAGQGIVHSEMFPLRHQDRPNPVELFQIWLNLPGANKLVPPYFSMFWGSTLPRLRVSQADGATAEVTVIAGPLPGATPRPPPPDSWASRADADVAIWTVKLQPGAQWTLPPAKSAATNRAVYFFRGDAVRIDDQVIPGRTAVQLRADAGVLLRNDSPEEVELLLLQGRPIGEPVAQHGPFVMNSTAELRQAFMDYHRTGFGGWPWPKDGPVQPRDQVRFAKHPDGRLERGE